jgi:peptidoglycan-associated lipoprotein
MEENSMKKIFVMGMLLSLSVFFITACADKRVVRPVQQETQQQQQQQPVAAPKETTEKKGLVKPEERITEQQLAKIETTDELAKYKEESGLFKDIFFDFDKYEVQQDAKAVLKNISSWLLKNNSAKILVEGHCDERGTNEYNLALGDRRSRAVRDYLVALGIGSSRIETISYGEEKPACKAATDECWAKNRRAHFVVLREAGK